MLSVFKKLFTSEPEEKKTVHTVSNFSWLEENNYIAYNKKFNPKLETVLLMDDREILEQIRDKIDIVSLISRYIPLKQAGKNLSACCPFHTENS